MKKPIEEEPFADVEMLHVYSPERWHSDAYIAGNRRGLMALRAAIDEALEKRGAEMTAFHNDGEGYSAIVLCLSGANVNEIAVPYTGEYAADNNPESLWPWKIAYQASFCSTHPDAPHGFDRQASHNAGRYVCECEGWAAAHAAAQPSAPAK